jgi:hypothetical protein
VAGHVCFAVNNDRKPYCYFSRFPLKSPNFRFLLSFIYVTIKAIKLEGVWGKSTDSGYF